jgi:hypothetical protein
MPICSRWNEQGPQFYHSGRVNKACHWFNKLRALTEWHRISAKRERRRIVARYIDRSKPCRNADLAIRLREVFAKPLVDTMAASREVHLHVF